MSLQLFDAYRDGMKLYVFCKRSQKHKAEQEVTVFKRSAIGPTTAILDDEIEYRYRCWTCGAVEYVSPLPSVRP